MIKKNFFLAFALLMVVNCFGQPKNYFEGTIMYQFEVRSKVANVNAVAIKKYFGNGSTLSFKQGNYYHKYDGGLYEFDLYNRADNKLYLKKRNNDTIFWHDCSLRGDTIQAFKFVAKAAGILGMLCDKLVIQYKQRTQVHYYNADSVKTNPDWFSQYKLDGENLVDEREQSVYLKSEDEFGAFIMIETAVKVTRIKIDDKIFKVPANAIFSKEE